MNKNNEKYQNFDSQSGGALEIAIVNVPYDATPSKYIGNHRIILKTGEKIVWTLGPQC